VIPLSVVLVWSVPTTMETSNAFPPIPIQPANKDFHVLTMDTGSALTLPPLPIADVIPHGVEMVADFPPVPKPMQDILVQLIQHVLELQ